MVTLDEIRAAFVEFLLEKISEDPYPSREHLEFVERSLPPDMVPDYVQVLLDKARQDRFPSNEILRRVERIVDC
ncbi:MAG: hypothetical protein QOG20_5325 [Pseudonocardiales bacterium]|jgi:hypothetical protein|uniref:hypothetical protein n=1 Tax=Pseudonocardia sp. TaxID=60912 RepID=UPI00260675BB|nr:hypothetical protein [Pseudonocardia sp.]MCW2716298.1 hypothetical protein [Pseudonocardia sp.]MDT7613452.1 hypothetical protein [Pseudonocardiales bacterium]MDT7709718.1 hypothetical protein [Pseudonocardiales bacterium]